MDYSRVFSSNVSFKNYICAFTAIKKTGESLESFTEAGLSSVHQTISRKYGHLQDCYEQCSKKKPNLNRWCSTCTKWQTILKSIVAKRIRGNVKWNKMESWKWPHHYKNIAEVFLPPEWANKHTGINLKDISTSSNIWSKCTGFPRTFLNVSKLVTNDRNDLVHNKSEMELSLFEKLSVFRNIKTLLNHPDIKPAITDFPRVIQIINDLENNKPKDYIDDIEASLVVVQKERLVSCPMQNRQNRRLIANTICSKTRKEIRNQHFMFQIGIPLFIILCCLTAWKSPQKQDIVYSDEDGCLPDNMHQTISLSGYLSYYQNFTGRRWLTSTLEREYATIDSSQHTIILAEMGYGKTAIMAQFICARKGETGYGIRQYLVAYHLCKYNIFQTKRVDTFIRRIIAMLSRRISEFRHIVETYSSCNFYLDERFCEHDPIGCLDQCLLFPLEQITYKENKPLVILVDALDECEDGLSGKNRILELLKQRTHTLPGWPVWIKFLLTSRNIYKTVDLEKHFKVLELSSRDKNNIEDVNIFLSEHIKNSSDIISNEILNNAHVWTFQEVSILTKMDISNINWKTLNGIFNNAYDMEFMRVFGESFQEAKLVLEVLCASFEPLTESATWTIVSNASDSPITHMKVFKSTLQKLYHFVKDINGELHIIHLSLKEWLTMSENTRFGISIENGHSINAQFLFKSLKSNGSNVDIVDLAIHTRKAINSDSLVRQFKSLTWSQLEEMEHQQLEQDSPLHRMARRIDDFEIAKLLLHHFSDVDKRNKQNITASYLAANFGHAKTLSCLLNFGANVNFKIPSTPKLIDFDVDIQIIMQHGHWGYGIIDTAAKNGHVSIVENLINTLGNKSNNLFTQKNDLNLLPIHMACKYGHYEIVFLLSETFTGMLDSLCLYYGSEIGNIEIVKLVISHGVIDTCRDCPGHLYWLPVNKTRVQGRKIANNEATPLAFQLIDYSIKFRTGNSSYVLFDDWNFIVCETALHIAVRRGHYDVVKVLLSQTQNAIQCRDRGGRTPLAGALQYNREDITKHVIRKYGYNSKEVCKDMTYINDTSYLNEEEIKDLQTYYCVPGHNLVHIAATYDRQWFVSLLKTTKNTIDWYIRDKDGCYPAHLAACHGSINILNYLMNSLDMDLNKYTCFNGTSLLQTAVICGSVESVQLLLNKHESFNKKSVIAMNAVLFNTEDEFAITTEHRQAKALQIAKLLIIDESQLHFQDAHGRNMFHIGIVNGHYKVISYIFTRFKSVSKKYLQQKDAFGKTPLAHAAEYLDKTQSVRFTTAYFYGDPVDDKFYLQVMSPKEYSIFQTMIFLKEHLNSNQLLSNELLNVLFERKNAHLVSVYFDKIHPTTCRVEVAKRLAEVFKYDETGVMATRQWFRHIKNALHDFLSFPLHKSSGQTEINPSLRLNTIYDEPKCGLQLTNSLFHLMTLHHSRVDPLKHLRRKPYNKVVDGVFETYISIFFLYKEKWSYCYDKDGYNILERSIQGGNHWLIKYLLSIGVTSNRSIEELLEMTTMDLKYKKPFTFSIKADFPFNNVDIIDLKVQNKILIELPCWDTNCSYITNDNDEVVSILLEKYHDRIDKAYICSENTHNYSFVHIAAMVGMFKSLKLMTEYWGKRILHCSNRDNFTPLYMAFAFGNVRTILFIESENIPLINPGELPELHFWFKLLSNFYLNRRSCSKLACLFKLKPASSWSSIHVQANLQCVKNAIRIINSTTLPTLSWTPSANVTNEELDSIISLLRLDIVGSRLLYHYSHDDLLTETLTIEKLKAGEWLQYHPRYKYMNIIVYIQRFYDVYEYDIEEMLKRYRHMLEYLEAENNGLDLKRKIIEENWSRIKGN